MTSDTKALVLSMRAPMPMPTKKIDGDLLALSATDVAAQTPSPRVWLPEAVAPHLPSLLPLPPLQPDLLSRGGNAFASTPARIPPASPSPEWSRRAAALGVSPRAAPGRPSRYSNPRHPGAARLASLGSFPNPEAGGVAAYPPSTPPSVVAARRRPLAATLPPSKAHWHIMRSVQTLGAVHAEYILRAQRTASTRTSTSEHERVELNTGMRDLQKLDAGHASADRDSGGVSALCDPDLYIGLAVYHTLTSLSHPLVLPPSHPGTGARSVPGAPRRNPDSRAEGRCGAVASGGKVARSWLAEGTRRHRTHDRAEVQPASAGHVAAWHQRSDR